VIPDAVAAVIAAVLSEHPAAGPQRLADLTVRELDALGWRIIPANRNRKADSDGNR
jgi:phage terminase Nu1 subunit (DNA packaging protein)